MIVECVFCLKANIFYVFSGREQSYFFYKLTLREVKWEYNHDKRRYFLLLWRSQFPLNLFHSHVKIGEKKITRKRLIRIERYSITICYFSLYIAAKEHKL